MVTACFIKTVACVKHSSGSVLSCLVLYCIVLYHIACMKEYKWAHVNQNFGSDQISPLRKGCLKNSSRFLPKSPRVASI